jgi:hypothetical protein
MASDLELQAKEAFVEDHFELAVELLTQAIDLDPKKSQLFADRAQANIKLNNFTGILSFFLFFVYPFSFFYMNNKVFVKNLNFLQMGYRLSFITVS